jgi:hypothetical protein
MTQPYDPDPRNPDPRYRDPQYEQPTTRYGIPEDRYAAIANAYGAPVGSGARFGVVGATLAGIGGVLLVIAFTALNWTNAAGSSTFGDLSDTLDVNGAANGLARNYFGWLGWLLAVLVVLVAVLANLPSPVSGPLQALGAVGAAAGIAVTFFAINFYSDGQAYTDYLKHARLGFYFALAGFALAGIGALVGPTKRV